MEVMDSDGRRRVVGVEVKLLMVQDEVDDEGRGEEKREKQIGAGTRTEPGQAGTCRPSTSSDRRHASNHMTCLRSKPCICGPIVTHVTIMIG